MLLPIVFNHRTAFGLLTQRTKAQARIGANQRILQLPFGLIIIDRGEQSLHANGEQYGKYDVEDRIE